MPTISNLSRDGFWFLASPYSDPSPEVRQNRCVSACIAAGELARRGFSIYSPIASWHVIANTFELPKDADWWWDVNLPFMRGSKGLLVLTLPGWSFSQGVQREIQWYMQNGRWQEKPIFFLDPDTLELTIDLSI